MEIKFYDNDNLIIGGGDWELAPFKFSKILKIGGGTSPSYIDIIISGTTSVTLTNAISLNYVKLFGGTEQRNLPKGYTQLDYIESTGTQYIDSGIYGDETTEIATTFQKTSATDSAIYGIFSGSTGNDNLVSYTTNISSNWRFDSTTASVPSLGTSKVTTVQNATGVWVNDTLYPMASTPTSFITSKTIPIFCRWAAVDSIYNSFTQAQIYTFSIKKNNILVFNGIPAKRNSDNVVGLYDTVSNTFLLNAGTGTFTAGPATVPTPDEPINIISNNGTIKYSANIANVNAQTALVGYYISSSGVVTADSNNWIYQDYIPVKPNTTYTLTMSSSVYYVTISEYSTADDSGFIRRNAGSSGDNTTLTITTGSTTNFVRFGTNIDRSEMTLDRVLAINWMLNIGNSLPYAPYSPNGIYTDGTVETVEVDTTGDTATAEMLLKVGDYSDEQEVLTGTVTRNIGIKVFDGTESFSVINNTFRYNLSGLKMNTKMICSHFDGNVSPSTTTSNQPDLTIKNNQSNNNNAYIKYTAKTTVEQFQQWLTDQYNAGTPVIVVFQLTEPTTETVTGQQLTVHNGTNTVEITQASIDGLPLEVSYKQQQ